MLWLDSGGKLHIDWMCKEIHGRARVKITIGLDLGFILERRCTACGEAADFEQMALKTFCLECDGAGYIITGWDEAARENIEAPCPSCNQAQ